MKLLRRHIDDRYKGNVSAFARALGFAPGRVYHWLRGRRVPNRLAAIKIARRSGIPLHVLLNGKLTSSIKCR